MTRKSYCLLGILMVLVLSLHAQAAPARVAILGDSITHDGRWATRVEAALRGTPEFDDAEIVNFGLGSETVSGLSEPNHASGKFPRPCLHERLDRILDAFHPTLVLACYGMNDGIYLPLDDSRLKAYQDGILKLKSAVEKQGGKIIFITPPLHTADKPSDDPARYDAVLDAYGDWLVSRRADGWQVIDIRQDLKQAVAAEKARDPAFIYAKDNVHPGEDGHRFIADSINRQLWPLLKLPGTPKLPDDEALAILRRRSDLLKLAWLTKTRHTRPGVPAGLPLDEAAVQAEKLMEEYLESVPAVSAGSGRTD
jgi:lysophospholipase L1-like esterase